MEVAAPAVDFSHPRGCDKPVRYAALPEYQTDLTKALKGVVNKLTTRVEGIVQPLPPALPCWLVLDCDNDLYPLIEERLKADLSLKTGRIFRLMTGKGLGAFDAGWTSDGIPRAFWLSSRCRYLPLPGKKMLMLSQWWY